MSTQLLIVIILLSIFIVILLFISGKKGLSYTFFAGLHGERAVSKELHRLGSRYVVFDDLLLKADNGTCQVDHVVLSPFGIFVIETKNFSGTVTGSDEWQQWYWGGKGFSRKIYSPVLQNARHVEVLSQVLGLSKDRFVSAVVFTGKAHIRIDTCHAVLFVSQLVPFIRLFVNDVLSDDAVAKCHRLLQEKNITDRRQREQHVCQVRKIRG